MDTALNKVTEGIVYENYFKNKLPKGKSSWSTEREWRAEARRWNLLQNNLRLASQSESRTKWGEGDKIIYKKI